MRKKDATRILAGKKTAAKAYAKYGDDYYKEIGRAGGLYKGVKGFATDPELARLAGAVGGKIGKRGKDTKPRKKRQKKVLDS